MMTRKTSLCVMVNPDVKTLMESGFYVPVKLALLPWNFPNNQILYGGLIFRAAEYQVFNL